MHYIEQQWRAYKLALLFPQPRYTTNRATIHHWYTPIQTGQPDFLCIRSKSLVLWFPANCWKSLCNNYTIKQSVSLSGSWYKHAPGWLRTCSCVIQASCSNVINVWQHSLGTALPGSEIYWQKSSLSTVSRWNTQWESWQIEVSCEQCLYSFIIFVT